MFMCRVEMKYTNRGFWEVPLSWNWKGPLVFKYNLKKGEQICETTWYWSWQVWSSCLSKSWSREWVHLNSEWLSLQKKEESVKEKRLYFPWGVGKQWGSLGTEMMARAGRGCAGRVMWQGGRECMCVLMCTRVCSACVCARAHVCACVYVCKQKKGGWEIDF